MDRDLRQQLMDQARAEAELGWAEGGIPIGAVLATESGEVVARGHNQRVQNGDPTSHARMFPPLYWGSNAALTERMSRSSKVFLIGISPAELK